MQLTSDQVEYDNERSWNGEKIRRRGREERNPGRGEKAKDDEIPRNGRRSRKAIYLLEALLSPAIRERACRQIRHASRTRRINFATKDPPELPRRRRRWLARERKRKRGEVRERAYEASCVHIADYYKYRRRSHLHLENRAIDESRDQGRSDGRYICTIQPLECI